MAQRTQVVNELKRVLKERGITYAMVAKKMLLSEASIKRLFSVGDFSLKRIDDICEIAGLQMLELVERANEHAMPSNRLTIAQEQEIVSDPKLFLVTWLVMNRSRFEDIVKIYAFTERELQKYLIKLDRLNIIELQPLNRVRLLVSRHFSWRAGGPVQHYLHHKLLKEFLAAPFVAERDEFFFHGGAMSEQVFAQLKRVLQHAARECIEIAERDQGLPATRVTGAFVLALRPWEYSGFSQYFRQ